MRSYSPRSGEVRMRHSSKSNTLEVDPSLTRDKDKTQFDESDRSV